VTEDDDWIEAEVAKAIANMEREIAAGILLPPAPSPSVTEQMRKLRGDYGPRYYNMDGKPIDMMEWAKSYQGNRHVGDTEIRFRGHVYRVSTVLLGLDHNFYSSGPPIIFETMVFEDGDMGGLDFQRRYSTKEQARRGHREAVRWVRGMIRETTMPTKPLIHNGHKP
jgi:hypothetical protein